MRYLTLVVILFVLCSCATVAPETLLPSQQFGAPLTENKTRVIFFNTSHKVLYLDGSWQIGIKIDGKGVANLDFDQYVQIDLFPGEHTLELSHVDLFTFRNKYNLNVGNETMYVKVYNMPVSTKYKILSEKPDDFEKRYKSLID